MKHTIEDISSWVKSYYSWPVTKVSNHCLYIDVIHSSTCLMRVIVHATDQITTEIVINSKDTLISQHELSYVHEIIGNIHHFFIKDHDLHT